MPPNCSLTLPFFCRLLFPALTDRGGEISSSPSGFSFPSLSEPSSNSFRSSWASDFAKPQKSTSAQCSLLSYSHPRSTFLFLPEVEVEIALKKGQLCPQDMSTNRSRQHRSLSTWPHHFFYQFSFSSCIFLPSFRGMVPYRHPLVE